MGKESISIKMGSVMRDSIVKGRSVVLVFFTTSEARLRIKANLKMTYPMEKASSVRRKKRRFKVTGFMESILFFYEMFYLIYISLIIISLNLIENMSSATKLDLIHAFGSTCS